MNNDERIRKWRQERGQPPARSAVVDDPMDELFPDVDDVSARVGRPGPGDGIQGRPLPDAISVEDARLAILERRRAQWRKIAQRIALFVLVPALAIMSYIWWVATPLYEGQAIFTVQTSADTPQSPAAGLFGFGGAGASIGDAFKAREFILSRPMMDYMEQHYGMMSSFESAHIDPLTRLKSPLGLNGDPYTYYQKRVRVAVDLQEGLLRLFVQARTPEESVRYGNAILAAAETHVNQFSDKISRDQIAALTRDVQGAERQVAESRRSLAAVQARRGDLSPEQTATAIYTLISSLESQLADAQRERNALLSQGLTDSPLLPGLTAKVQDLTGQIAEQHRRLVNPGGSSLQKTADEFESASSRKEIAQARWQSTMNTLQQAYLRVLEERRYFVLIVGMSVAGLPKVRDGFPIIVPILLFLAFIYALVFAARRSGGRFGSVPNFRWDQVVRRWNRR
ncbi:BexC/CtrB/KpsE family polysaccharide export inner-membrane protein [Sphingomonas sp. F9_3S_D5_B_2]